MAEGSTAEMPINRHLRQQWGPFAGLLATLASTAICLATVLSKGPGPALAPDSGGYLQFAYLIGAGRIPTDPSRTPGYPLLIAAIRHVGLGLGGVVLVQACLAVATALAWFALTRRVSRSVAIATLGGVLVGCDLEAAGYVRLILTESFAFVTIAATFCSYWYWLQRPSWQRNAMFASSSSVLVLIRPALLTIPISLLTFEIVRSAFRRETAIGFRRVLNASSGFVIVLATYVIANGMSSGYFGISDVGSINTFGKVLEYRMEILSTARDYGMLPAVAHRFTQLGNDNPNVFAERYPDFVKDHWSKIGAFSNDVIIHHPREFIAGALKDSVLVLVSPPRFQRSFAGAGTQIDKGVRAWRNATTAAAYPAPSSLPLQALTAIESIGYLILIGSSGAAVYLLYRNPSSPLAIITAAMLLVSVAGVLSVAAGGPPGAFERLRLSYDAPMLIGTALLGYQLRPSNPFRPKSLSVS